MRDADRDARRDAAAVAKVASSDFIRAELAGRLRELVRRSPPHLLMLFPCLWIAAMLLSWFYRPIWWMELLPHFVSAVLLCHLAVRDRGGEHGVSHYEYLETLSAMEPIANSAPEKLISSLPELRRLAGAGVIAPEVRAKARELLAKVHEASLHELPIAAEPPQRDATELPVVAMRDGPS